jgi:hypothetical protein
MSRRVKSYPGRFARWLFGSPFRELPPAFGSTVPSELQMFEAEAAEAGRRGLGGIVALAPVHHRKTHPKRLESWMERQ